MDPSQDPKANPGSTFSASVNFATSGYSKYSATNSTTSSRHSQLVDRLFEELGRHTVLALGEHVHFAELAEQDHFGNPPTLVFNVSRFYPFKRKEKQGKDRWYEKSRCSTRVR